MHRLGGALVAATITSGCIAQTTTTRVAVRDTAEVSLVTASGTLEPHAKEAVVGDSTFSPEPGATSHYTLVARRDADGAIAFEWKTTAPLLNGEHQVVLPADGKLEPHARFVGPETVRRGKLQITSCATLDRALVKGSFVGYRAGEWDPCGAAVSIPFTLETPWENVTVLHKRTDPDKEFAVDMMIATSVVLGATAAIVFAISGAKNEWGWVAVGSAVVIDLLLVPTLFAKAHDDVVYTPTEGK